MPDLSDLVPLHLGQVRNLFLLVLGQVQRKLIQFYNILLIITNLHVVCSVLYPLLVKLTCRSENSVDPDQLTSKEAS